MQIDVHRVDAEIAGPRLADDRVEIRAVAIEVGAGLMHGLGDLDDLALEQSAGVRIGQHDRGDVRPERRLDGGTGDGAVRRRRNWPHREADQRRGRRIGAVRAIGHEDDIALRRLRPWPRSRP